MLLRILLMIVLIVLAVQAAVAAPSAVNYVPLDITQVTTGGSAVNAWAAGHRLGGGWIVNPSTATAPLCINEVGTATTTAQGNTTCIAPGTSYTLSPSANALSVNSTDGPHPFSGMAYQ